MQIISWNVNSIRAREAFVAAFLDEVSPDILCLQELKCTDAQLPRDLFESRGYKLAVHGQVRWNGVLIASKQELSDVKLGHAEIEGEQSRFIEACVGGLRLINVYCPQGQAVDSPKFSYKLGFFDALIAYISETVTGSERFVLTGDINIAPGPDDIYDPARFEGVPSYHPEEHARFKALLALGLSDVVKAHITAGTYSFWDYRGGAFRNNRGMRIDHFLASGCVAELVRGASVMRSWRKKRGEHKASDHAPVELRLDL